MPRHHIHWHEIFLGLILSAMMFDGLKMADSFVGFSSLLVFGSIGLSLVIMGFAQRIRNLLKPKTTMCWDVWTTVEDGQVVEGTLVVAGRPSYSEEGAKKICTFQTHARTSDKHFEAAKAEYNQLMGHT